MADRNQTLDRLLEALHGARRIVDIGCGSCALLQHATHDRVSQFADLVGFLTYLRSADPGRIALIAAKRNAVAAAFARHAVPQHGGFALIQPMAIWLFKTDPTDATPL